MERTQFNETERDLLVRLNERVANLQKAVEDLSCKTMARIETLEKCKTDKEEFYKFRDDIQTKINKDIEMRLNNVETWKTQRTENIKEETKWNKIFLSGLYLLAGLIFGLVFWHILDYQI
jgi:hypothetical protein